MRDRQPNYNKGYFVDGPYRFYDYVEITVSGGISDYDVQDSGNLFDGLIQGQYLEVTSSGADLQMKMNGSGNAAIPIEDGVTWSVSDFLFTNLYFTNQTGTDASVKLFVMGHR